MAETPVLRFVAAGDRYDVDLADFTARDSADFRKTVGIPLSAAIAEGSVDIDVIAGLVWLVRRSTDRRLSYHSVAETLNYANVEQVPDEPTDVDIADEVEAGDPTSPEA